MGTPIPEQIYKAFGTLMKKRKNPKVKTFQSVILSGVTDVRHLKNKIRDDDRHKVNSPWNIAADS